MRTHAATSKVEQKTQTQDGPQSIASRVPIIDNDYVLNRDDTYATFFIRCSYQNAKVVHIGEHILSVWHLRPNVDQGFIFDEVQSFK